MYWDATHLLTEQRISILLLHFFTQYYSSNNPRDKSYQTILQTFYKDLCIRSFLKPFMMCTNTNTTTQHWCAKHNIPIKQSVNMYLLGSLFFKLKLALPLISLIPVTVRYACCRGAFLCFTKVQHKGASLLMDDVLDKLKAELLNSKYWHS